VIEKAIKIEIATETETEKKIAEETEIENETEELNLETDLVQKKKEEKEIRRNRVVLVLVQKREHVIKPINRENARALVRDVLARAIAQRTKTTNSVSARGCMLVVCPMIREHEIFRITSANMAPFSIL
jgi:hypothetical protein